MTSLTGYVPRAYGARFGYQGGGIAGMFQGLGEGLSRFAQMTQQEEESKAKTAQEAARQAFEDNLRRFQVEHEDAREHERTTAMQQERTDTNARLQQQFAASEKDRQQSHADTVANRNLQIQLERMRIGDNETREKRLEDSAAARDKKNDAAQTLHEAHQELGDINVERNRLATDAAKAQSAYQFAATHGDETEKAAAQQALTEAQSKYQNYLAESDGRRRELDQAIGRPDKSMPDDVKALGPEAQATWNNAVNSGNQVDVLELQRQIKGHFGKPTADTDGAPDSATATPTTTNAGQDDNFLDTQPPGAQATPSPAAATASTQVPPGAVPTPSPADATATPDATADQSGDAAPTTHDFNSIASTLGGSADGQAVSATLQRLSESPTGPGADKMRRSAEIGMQDLGFDKDTATAYIDNYVSGQNSGSPDLDSVYNNNGVYNSQDQTETA